MKKRKTINIAVALDGKYTRYVYVMLTSLIHNNDCKDINICVYMMYTDMRETEKAILSELLDNNNIDKKFIHIDRGLFPPNCPVSDMWPIEVYFRILLPYVLPKDINRILYLDADTIVNQSLQDLWDVEFEGKLICACEDPCEERLSKNIIFDEIRNQGFTYFNSGVLLMNVAGIREKYDLKDYLDIMKKIADYLQMPDQDLLNYVHQSEVKILDFEKYNLYAKVAYNHDVHYDEVKQAVTIIHFAGQKPWQGKYIHFDIEQLWWDYAKQTPFYYELMEEYLYDSINDPTVYNTMLQSVIDKQELKEELEKSVVLCQKLAVMLQEGDKG